MTRRAFITLLGGAAAAWPLAARAQQPSMPAIGLLDAQLPASVTKQLRGFRQGPKDVGFVEGENVAIECRFADLSLSSPVGAEAFANLAQYLPP